MSIKSSIGDIVGKTIKAVVVSKNDGTPRDQVFIVFDDDRSLEFFGSDINCAGGLDGGGVFAAISYAKSVKSTSIRVYPPSEDPTIALFFGEGF